MDPEILGPAVLETTHVMLRQYQEAGLQYHALSLWNSHDWHVAGSLYVAALVPGGAMGCTFQSYSLPLYFWYADWYGCFLDTQHIFNVMIPCSVNWSQNCSGQSLLAEQNMLMMRVLQVCIALSAALPL